MKLFDRLMQESQTAADAEFAKVIAEYKANKVRWWFSKHIGGSYCYMAAFEASFRSATAAQKRRRELIAAFREEQRLLA